MIRQAAHELVTAQVDVTCAHLAATEIVLQAARKRLLVSQRQLKRRGLSAAGCKQLFKKCYSLLVFP